MACEGCAVLQLIVKERRSLGKLVFFQTHGDMHRYFIN